MEIFSLDYVKQLFADNFFQHDFTARPVIVVYRNIDSNGQFVADTGMNNCDRVLLVDASDIHVLTGRTYPNDKYQHNNVTGKSKANYIASGYYPTAWRKGPHFKLRALRQNAPFMIWRSKDMELMDEDDYNQYAVVADNFHGWAPASAGCVTVVGQMRPPVTGDWKIADNWIYNTHAKTPLFSAAIFHHWDLDGQQRLRMGSRGEKVKDLQNFLNKKGAQLIVDGDFGPASHNAVRDYQRAQKVPDSGMIKLSDIG